MYIQNSVNYLKNGKVILYPTDTIWGIGGDATNKKVIEKIYEIKMRPKNLSFIILVDSLAMLKNYVERIPETTHKILSSPIPTTIIFPKAKNLVSELLGKDNSIAIRVVKSRFCQDLIQTFGKPIISTSANISGMSTPLDFRDVGINILNKVDYVVPLPEWSGTKNPSRIIKVSVSGETQIIRT